MTTAPGLADRLAAFVAAQVEAIAAHHLPGWRIPGTFAGHAVGADVRADTCFTLSHLADAGTTTIAGTAIDDVISRLLREVDGAATHTFFSYRIAETVARAGTFDGNRLLAGLDDRQRAEVAGATDSTEWVRLLDGGALPRNYAAVLARCELGRVRLGLAESTTTLDALVERLAALLGESTRRMLDDANDRVGRYDIYAADIWLFCEPLADRLGDLWREGAAAALDLVWAVGSRNGAAVPWGRSTGDLGVALTLELATLALADGALAGDRRSPWLRRACEAMATLEGGFDADGLSSAHRHRSQDSYRGPARRLQLTFDLLGKVAWSAAALRRADPAVEPSSIRDAFPVGEGWHAFEDRRAAGAWAHRSPGVDIVVPFVGTTRSHYLPAVHQPGAFEAPMDRDLPTWAPLVVDGGRRYTAGGVPAAVEPADGSVTARWDALPVSGGGLDGTEVEPPLAGTRTVRIAVEGRTIVVSDHLALGRAPDAIGVSIPEVAGRPLRVEWACDAPHATTTITVDGLAEWRSPWSEIETVHQLDIDPATDVRWTARVTPLIRLGSTELEHHYSQSLHEPMDDRVIAVDTPVGWRAPPGRSMRGIDVLHLHWPEWLAFDDLAAHEAIIADLADHDVPVLWTAHNLTPHVKRPEVFDPIYGAWAAAVDGVVHHTAWGMRRMRERYAFRPDCRHEVIPHGHFGRLWADAGHWSREQAEQRLGLAPCPLRIGIVGAPREEKLVQVVLDAVASCARDDVELVCWSLGPEDVVPDDPRIAIAERYEMVDRRVYARRLATCDVLALVFDPAGEMLATGAAADAIGLGLPALRSEWGYLVETLGGAGIPVGHTVESVATAIDALTPSALEAARTAAEHRRTELDWSGLAAKTADLLERIVQHLP